MAGADNPQPKRLKKPTRPGAEAPRKPLQVMHISKKEAQQESKQEPLQDIAHQKEEANGSISSTTKHQEKSTLSPFSESSSFKKSDVNQDNFDNISMADLLGPPDESNKGSTKVQLEKTQRSVDDFDFDEDAFLAALDENEPIGNTGEIATGEVIGIESDGVYVDIGGKAPGFMPKKECGLGVITNLKERFPKGLEVEVLVTREQNADGMVTISCRALALRKSWERVREQEKEGKVVQVKVNGFNRGGVTCDLEGLRGFIPRSQLDDGENHENYVGKTVGVAFLEVNPDTRKLVLSQKRAVVATRLAELKVGQLVEGKVASVKPYGFFVDLGGASGLLHQSMITNGSIRSLRQVFSQGDPIKAIIVELDPGRGRISLNTALLEGPPGELLSDKEKVMKEAEERADKARKAIQEKQDKKIEEKENSQTLANKD